MKDSVTQSPLPRHFKTAQAFAALADLIIKFEGKPVSFINFFIASSACSSESKA
jgi:hypothetical protein